MQRSTTQVLFRHLPDAIFFHDDGFIAQVNHINGSRVGNLNRRVLLDELAEELDRWLPEQVGIPNPRTNASEYVMILPEEVSWDVFPLTFECTNQRCKRVIRWFRQSQVIDDTNALGRIECPSCHAKLRQLRYVTAHNCGTMQPLHTPTCGNCSNTDHMYLEDLGSFVSSSWRCRQCGWAQSTRFTPCSCGQYARGAGTAYQQGYAPRDQRLWTPQTLTIINISDQTYDHLQQHAQRGVAALASWLGDEEDIAASLADLNRAGSGSRLTEEEWSDQERRLREAGVDEHLIESLRAQQGPALLGAAAITAGTSAEVIEWAGQRSMVERAGLFDRRIIDDRRTFGELRAEASGAAQTTADYSAGVMAMMGIDDISVTQRFPIVVASYGYTRVQRDPGRAHLRGYAKPRQYNGKTPIFTVPADTESLLVVFDARSILGFLESEGDLPGPVPAGIREAQLVLAEMLALDTAVGGDSPAGKTRRLVHSASHALLRALDDGQTGFGESSLAEWIVPDALTTAIYVASYNDFTLGAFDTVLRRRLSTWLLNTLDNVTHCDNDPMCSQTSSHRPHAACDRCLHLSFGCRSWNADLDRRLLRRFWLWTQRQAAART
jgi:hypothetical protein